MFGNYFASKDRKLHKDTNHKYYVLSPQITHNATTKHTLLAFSQILTQSRLPCSGLLTMTPQLSKPRMSLPTLLVRPDSISCLCRNSFWRAYPRPLSSSACVRTPSRVLLPASTFPTTATLPLQPQS